MKIFSYEDIQICVLSNEGSDHMSGFIIRTGFVRPWIMRHRTDGINPFRRKISLRPRSTLTDLGFGLDIWTHYNLRLEGRRPISRRLQIKLSSSGFQALFRVPVTMILLPDLRFLRLPILKMII